MIINDELPPVKNVVETGIYPLPSQTFHHMC